MGQKSRFWAVLSRSRSFVTPRDSLRRWGQGLLGSLDVATEEMGVRLKTDIDALHGLRPEVETPRSWARAAP